MQIPVLTYHAARIGGDDYALNHHVAFFEDLRLLHNMGLRVADLNRVVRRLRAGDSTIGGDVAITFDDGTDFDYFDLPHPTWGTQRSMLNIMKDFIKEFGANAQPDLHATSFVIASPKARRELDRTCLIGRDWYTDDWWPEAIASGLMSIANHSWDHLHPTLEVVAQRQQKKGTFGVVDTYEDADAQIRQATDYLMCKTENRASRLFAYPYGESTEYLTTEYLPNFEAEHRLEGAFTTSAAVLTASVSIWELPRFVCGQHWKCSEDLAAILTRAHG